MRILGLDPSISSTGWGIIDVEGNRLSYVADGFIPTPAKEPLSHRLHIIYSELKKIIEDNPAGQGKELTPLILIREKNK